MSELPKGWEKAKLDDLCIVEMGQSPPGSSYNDTGDGTPLINGPVEFGPNAFSKTIRAKYTTEPKKFCEEGDLILCVRGSTTGRMNIAGFEAAIGRGVAAIRSRTEDIFQGFINHFINAKRQDIYDLGTGSTFPNVSKSVVGEIEVPLPPLPEQRRIVARIEELFSRLDAGVAALRHAKAQLQRYRQSVLAAAVTGQLTQAWREQHPDTEPASELLGRILEQKREQWAGKRKYKEPPLPVTDELPKLPSSWAWATVAQQAAPDERAITDGPFGSKLKSSHYTDSGPRVLRLQNIGDGFFKDEYAHIPDDHFQTLRNHEIFAGDLVIRALGIPAHQTCIVPPSVGPAIVKADCIRFKVFEPHINPRFTLFALNSHPVRSRSERHIHGVGRPRLNGTEIKGITLPLPPLAEQHQIVAEVEARTTAIDHLEAELDRQITRSNRLRQSTLSAAFSGNLVESANFAS